jgi:hypothetical protein
MTGQIRLTDDALEAMLRTRAARTMPGGLEATIVAAVVADDPGLRVRARPRAPRRRAWPLLVAAMVTVGLGGGLVWTAAQQHQTTPPTFDRTAPPTPAPSLAIVEPTTAPSPAQPAAAACPDMDALAAEAGVGRLPVPVVRPASAAPTNGQLVAMMRSVAAPWPASAEIARLDPSVGEASATAISPLRLDGRGAVNLAGSPDGNAIALSYGFTPKNSHNGGAPGTPCAAVIVMAPDGSAAREPVRVGLHEGVVWPTWGPDGRLAMVHDGGAGAGLVLWDPGTDQVVDLGQPCNRCGIEAPPWWTLDGSGLIVTYLDPSCTTTAPPPLDKTAPYVDPQQGHDCGRLAISDGRGPWRLVPVEPGHREWMTVDGWLDASTVVVTEDDPATLAGRPLAVNVLTGVTANTAWPGRWSPDRTRVAIVHEGSGRPSVEVMETATRKRARIEAPRNDTTDLAVTWSPDSRWLALQAFDESQGIWVVPSDGSQPPRQVLSGNFGPWAWLAATP